MANANKPSLGSSTQQGTNVSNEDVEASQNQSTKDSQNSPRNASRKANETGKQGGGKNK